MSATVTTDAIGKDVVGSSGEKIGLVVAVEYGTAYVEPDPGITDEFRALLGWENRTEDTYPLQEEAIETITADEIRLRDELDADT